MQFQLNSFLIHSKHSRPTKNIENPLSEVELWSIEVLIIESLLYVEEMQYLSLLARPTCVYEEQREIWIIIYVIVNLVISISHYEQGLMSAL